MKILHVNCNYMGTKLHQTMIEHLEKYNNDNVIYCPIYDGSNIVTKPNKNVIVSKCFKAYDRLFFFKKQHKIYNDLLTKIDVRNYDLVHAYTLFTDGNVAYEINKRFNLPYCIAVRSTDFEFLKYKFYLKSRGIKILLNSSKIFFLSEVTKNIFIEKYVPKKYKEKINKKIEIIPNGIDDFWLDNKYTERKCAKKEEYKIITVSQIIRRKNIPLLQKAISYLNNKGYHISLEVIGKGTDKNLLEIIKNDQNTTYYDFLSKEDLIHNYRSADIFALPSKGETFGLVYAEAMTQNLPVIYSKSEGFDGQFSDSSVGYAIDNASYISIAEGILKCIHNTEHFLQNVDKSSKFCWNFICSKYYEIYKEILANRNNLKSYSLANTSSFKLRLYLHSIISLPKTIYFNLRYLPLEDALKLPILISYKTKIYRVKKNTISFKNKPYTFMVKIGFGGSEPINASKGKLILESGKIIFEGKATFSEGCSIRNSGIIRIGNNFFSNKNSVIWCDNSISIGDNNLFGWNVMLRDSDGHYIIENNRINENSGSIVLKNHVWLASNVSVLKNSIVPDNCVIGYGSLVTKKFENANCIYAGVPAKKVKENIEWERGS